MFPPSSCRRCAGSRTPAPTGWCLRGNRGPRRPNDMYLHRHLARKGDAPTYCCIDTFSVSQTRASGELEGALPLLPFALVDVEQLRPVRAALAGHWEVLVSGGILVVDDFGATPRSPERVPTPVPAGTGLDVARQDRPVTPNVACPPSRCCPSSSRRAAGSTPQAGQRARRSRRLATPTGPRCDDMRGVCSVAPHR